MPRVCTLPSICNRSVRVPCRRNGLYVDERQDDTCSALAYVLSHSVANHRSGIRHPPGGKAEDATQRPHPSVFLPVPIPRALPRAPLQAGRQRFPKLITACKYQVARLGGIQTAGHRQIRVVGVENMKMQFVWYLRCVDYQVESPPKKEKKNVDHTHTQTPPRPAHRI